MRTFIHTYINLDKLGMLLSSLCAIHCVLTPLIILSVPMMARYYLAHPYFHGIFAGLILPVGVAAFVSGYRHHHNAKVFWLGIPGLLIVSVAPILVHNFGFVRGFPFNETTIMVAGSVLVIWAHWLNRRSCACDLHTH
jgi:MerC mercury resistance protein